MVSLIRILIEQSGEAQIGSSCGRFPLRTFSFRGKGSPKLLQPSSHPLSCAALKRFLIIRFSSIGDIVLTSPVIRCLRKRYPDAAIHYVTKKQYAPLVAFNPYLTRVHTLDGKLGPLVEELRRENFDFIIDLHGSLRSRILRWRLRRPGAVFPKLNFRKWLLVTFKINLLPDRHIVDRYLSTLKSLHVQPDELGLDYFLPADKQDVRLLLPEPFRKGYLVLAAGAKHNTKQITQEQMVSLCRLIEVPVVILGGKEDFTKAEEVRLQVEKSSVFNGCGLFSLNESASLVKNARLVITPDTGIMHIASAFGRDILSVWGNTTPAFGMYPYRPGKNSRIFEIKDLPCRPCSKLGHNTCPKKHFRCMLEQPVSEIAALANTLGSQG